MFEFYSAPLVGVPELIRTDGAQAFVSRQFNEFLRDWSVYHCTSSPHYPRSNGLAESAVKSAKKLLRRCWDDSRGRLNEREWTRGLIQQRNTPGVSGRSPAEIVFGRPLRDDLPTHPSRFNPPLSRLQHDQDGPMSHRPTETPADRRESRRHAAKQWYDQHAHDLPEFPEGTRVRVQDVRTKRWDRCGVVVRVGPYRRYRVRFDDGGEVDRNRCHLRKRHALYPMYPVPQSERTASKPTSSGVAAPRAVRQGEARQERALPRRSSRERRPVRRLIEEM